MKKLRQKLNKLMERAKLATAYFGYISQKYKIILEDIRNSVQPGTLSSHQVKSLILIFLIAFTSYVILFKQYYCENFVSVQKNYVVGKSLKEIKKEKLEKDLSVLVEGHPIQLMIPYIVEKDRKTAAYLVGIAKKESNWGKRKPVLNGEDCYNYWGFRAKRERMGSGGHTCFDTPKEAVDVISKRIDQIIERNDVESAQDLLVWKCGSDCSVTGGQAAADKWAVDVDMYAKEILN